MRYLNVFEQVTRVRAKDFFTSETVLFFLTDKGNAKIAIGKQGINVRNLSTSLQRKVKILEWTDNAEGLVRAYLYPVIADSVGVNADKNVEILFKFAKQRRYLLDNKQENLHELLALVKHFHPEIAGIKVL